MYLLGMVAEKSMRATKIAAALATTQNPLPLVAELQQLYPQFDFRWDADKGLCVHMPIGSIRMPQALWHAAGVVTQFNGWEHMYLKNKFGDCGIAPAPGQRRTWHERLLDDSS